MNELQVLVETQNLKIRFFKNYYYSIITMCSFHCSVNDPFFFSAITHKWTRYLMWFSTISQSIQIIYIHVYPCCIHVYMYIPCISCLCIQKTPCNWIPSALFRKRYPLQSADKLSVLPSFVAVWWSDSYY